MKNGTIFKEKKDMCYVYNYNNMRHILLTKEIYNYINESKVIGIDNLLKKFINDEDKKYIKDIYDKYNAVLNEKIDTCISSVYISITNRCNLRCIHCCSNSESETEDLSLEDFQVIIDNLKKINPENIVISGGEPLLNNSFEKIVSTLKYVLPNSTLTLSTNATLISPENVVFIIKNFNSVEISLDGYDYESVKLIRGEYVYDKVINNIKLLKKNNLKKISISMVFGEKNVEKMDEFIDLNNKIGTIPIIRYFVPEGRGYDNHNIYTDKKCSIPITICSMYNKFIKKGDCLPDSCSCYAYIDSFFINYDGHAYPCTSLINDEFVIYDFTSKSFDEKKFHKILKDKRIEFTNKYMKFNNSKCEKCDVNVFCWKCPAIYVNALLNNEIDLWCSLMSENINSIVWGSLK